MTTAFVPQDFSDGWRKLPDELKLMILAYALPHGLVCISTYFDRYQMDQECGKVLGLDPPAIPLKTQPNDYMGSFEANVLPLLACPEIRCLVYEVFYGQNTMKLHRIYASDVSFPPRSIGIFVHSVQLHVTVGAEGYTVLEKLANGGLGMQNLRSLDINIGIHRNKDAVSVLPNNMQFRTQRLQVTFKPFYCGSPAGREKNDFNDVMMSCFGTLLRAGNVNEQIERSYIHFLGRQETLFVDVWPRWILRQRSVCKWKR